jgi:hypothetical protein
VTHCLKFAKPLEIGNDECEKNAKFRSTFFSVFRSFFVSKIVNLLFLSMTFIVKMFLLKEGKKFASKTSENLVNFEQQGMGGISLKLNE